MKNLVIVESPNKIKKLGEILGKDYKVMSSYGHIRDLRKKDFSIDVDHDFAPQYEIPADKKDLVRQLKEAVSSADMVWIAADDDREGEAIAWHLYEVLGLTPENSRRIVFHEITPPAVLESIKNPRGIDIARVNAQQARRVIDRMVGFELSPVLWRKIKPALSAGRVQSVAVRLVCEREKEVLAFKPEPFYRVNAVFADPRSGEEMSGELNRRLDNKEEARALLSHCATLTQYTVTSVETKPLKRSPAAPFTTSTLLQEASRRLGMSVAQVMSVAQKLYEAGHITYMRTDSLNLSELALKDIADTITSSWGDKYLHTRRYHTKSKGAQEAHEAIRPAYIAKETIDGTQAEKRLYDLIRKRTLASQMGDAVFEKTNMTVSIDGRQEEFDLEGKVTLFDGFLKVYATNDNTKNTVLPPLAQGDTLAPVEMTATQRFTQAPARYDETALTKKMEDIGIGRPSTYSAIISTIQTRGYVERGSKEGTPRPYEVLTLTPPSAEISEQTLSENTGSNKGKLVPTDVGVVVNDFLTVYFPDILDYNFTAHVEEKFDEISQGKLDWQNELKDFYSSFHPDIEKINSMRTDRKVGERRLGIDPKSGRPVSVKIGRYGPMVQIGETGDEEKPLFAGMLKGQSMQTITLEEALKLFELPRTLGEYEGKTVTAAIGRFGPYVRHDKAFVSIPKELTPQAITLEEAVKLIEDKREADKNKHIKSFDELPGVEVLNGRFGPYIACRKEGAKKAVNYKIPKGQDAAALTVEEVQAIMKAQDEAPARPRRRAAAAPKTATKTAKTTKTSKEA